MISNSAITAMAVAGVYCILLPIILLIVWKCRSHAKLTPFFVGMGIFILFAMILENLLHQVCVLSDNGVSRAITGSAVLTTLYGGLAAGIFEETGRLAAFKLMKKHTARETAITYGLGHGGIEAILLIGVSLLLNAVYAMAYNAGGLEALTAQVGDETSAAMLVLMMERPATIYLYSMWERSYTVIFHVALSVLVFGAVHTPGKRWLFPVAILLHAGVDCFAMLYQQGLLGLTLTEIIGTVYTICVAVFAYRIYRQMPETPQEVPGC